MGITLMIPFRDLRPATVSAPANTDGRVEGLCFDISDAPLVARVLRAHAAQIERALPRWNDAWAPESDPSSDGIIAPELIGPWLPGIRSLCGARLKTNATRQGYVSCRIWGQHGDERPHEGWARVGRVAWTDDGKIVSGTGPWARAT